tara:strand:+ start:1383 stop:1646 length:264 start_codon:yes stop_codon:yes gene_type:complete
VSDEHNGDKKQYFFDKPRHVRIVIRILVAACVATFGADFFLHRHVNHHWESMLGFYALFGFGAYALLVLVAEGLRFLVQKRDGFYDD